ncbi:MAG: tetratricopeptide repeat protein, partial [Duncaniella sp.]|nr:tetratricopeptide repeat protein [Duncaniella sp.]
LELTDEADMSAAVLEHAGAIYFMDGEPDKAIDFWKEALKLAPDNELLQRKVKNKSYYFK